MIYRRWKNVQFSKGWDRGRNTKKDCNMEKSMFRGTRLQIFISGEIREGLLPLSPGWWRMEGGERPSWKLLTGYCGKWDTWLYGPLGWSSSIFRYRTLPYLKSIINPDVVTQMRKVQIRIKVRKVIRCMQQNLSSLSKMLLIWQRETYSQYMAQYNKFSPF